jgi:hypothetical protein
LQRIWAVVNSGKEYEKREVEFEKPENSKSKKNKQKKLRKICNRHRNQQHKKSCLPYSFVGKVIAI